MTGIGGAASAAADEAVVDCPELDVVFARGTGEDVGVGTPGGMFVEALQSSTPVGALRITPVDYPASADLTQAAEGVANARDHIVQTAAACPNTRFVLGGFSQGAAVMNLLTGGPTPVVVPGAKPLGDRRCGTTGNVGHCGGSDSTHAVIAAKIEESRRVWGVADPLPPEYASRVAAVVAFGDPFDHLPAPINGNAGYEGKSIDFCNVGDPVCGEGDSIEPHLEYGPSGLTDAAAQFVATILGQPAPPLDPLPAPAPSPLVWRSWWEAMGPVSTAAVSTAAVSTAAAVSAPESAPESGDGYSGGDVRR